MREVGFKFEQWIDAGGWSAPSPLGWALVLMFWLAIWWAMASLLTRLVTKRRSQV